MAEEVFMPKLAATMEKGTIIEWLKGEGDHVKEGEPILEIMTDKINLEVEAPASGVILKTLYEPDSEVEVFSTIAYIGEANENIAQLMTNRTHSHKSLGETSTKEDRDQSIKEVVQKEELLQLEFAKPRRTPAARKLARKYGVDLNQVKGSGPRNRIHKADVQQFIENNRGRFSVEHSDMNEKEKIQERKANLDQLDHRTVPYNGLRKLIGDRMVQSWNTSPHVTLHSEIDMTAVIRVRGQLLPVIEKMTGFRLSYSEIIMKAAAYALKANPNVNASLKGNRIERHSDINIGLAVAVSDGLIVPVIKNVNRKGLAQLTEESKHYALQARENNISPDQLQGGTFTISNLGMYAVDSFTPIIQQPQTAILGIGQIRERVISINETFQSRSFVMLSLSFDHRVVDGAPAARFLTDLKQTLENPYTLMV